MLWRLDFMRAGLQSRAMSPVLQGRGSEQLAEFFDVAGVLEMDERRLTMALKDEWDRLDTEARTWLLDNPGCVLVPHAVTAAIQQASAGPISVDGHGQMILTREDLDFIRTKGSGVGAGPPTDQFTFFDAVQPGHQT